MKQEYFKSALLGLKQLLAIESPLKMMKNASYFTSKAVSFSKIFRFFLDVFIIYQNGVTWLER